MIILNLKHVYIFYLGFWSKFLTFNLEPKCFFTFYFLNHSISTDNQHSMPTKRIQNYPGNIIFLIIYFFVYLKMCKKALNIKVVVINLWNAEGFSSGTKLIDYDDNILQNKYNVY